MALNIWFSKTRKYALAGKALPKLTNTPTRKLEPVEKASMRVFGYYQNPTPGMRSGRDILRKNLTGAALTRWWLDDLRTFPGLANYKSEQERYQLAKNSFLRTKGKIPPKKGAGKKALKRAADAKKAAAKAAKK